MNKPVQFIMTPKGERLVVIPERDYRNLLEAAEELADIAAFNKAMAREEAGEELLPFDDVKERLQKASKPAVRKPEC